MLSRWGDLFRFQVLFRHNKTVTTSAPISLCRALERQVRADDFGLCKQGVSTMPNSNQLETERSKRSKHGLAPKDEPTLRQNDMMDALVAACAIVAYADGNADAAERKRLLGLMRRIPLLEGFSRDDLAEEFSRQEQAFEADPVDARNRALAKITASRPNAHEARAVLRSCEEIIQADGVAHPLEQAAMRSIIHALAP
jgi:tellurite resistance protein